MNRLSGSRPRSPLTASKRNQDSINGLVEVLKHQNSSPHEEIVARSLLHDLRAALRGERVSIGMEDLLRAVAASSSALDALIRDDVEFYEEIIPHVFFADISAWALRAAETGHAPPALEALLIVLEEHLAQGDDDVQDVIVASFVENTYDQQVIYDLYGSCLRRAAAPWLAGR